MRPAGRRAAVSAARRSPREPVGRNKVWESGPCCESDSEWSVRRHAWRTWNAALPRLRVGTSAHRASKAVRVSSGNASLACSHSGLRNAEPDAPMMMPRHIRFCAGLGVRARHVSKPPRAPFARSHLRSRETVRRTVEDRDPTTHSQIWLTTTRRGASPAARSQAGAWPAASALAPACWPCFLRHG